MFPTATPELCHIALEGLSDHDITYQSTNREKVEVIRFDFMEQLKDLLGDNDIFGDIENLVVNPTNHWHPYDPSNNKLDKVLDGSWYQQTIQRIMTDPESEMILPIIMYLDKTGIDAYQRYGLEPLTFTTAVINRKTRNQTKSWRPLGFIPDLDLSSRAAKTAARQKKSGKGRSTRNYHKCLHKILESFVDAQQKKPVMWIRIGNHMKKMKVLLPLAFVIGDVKSNDHLCCRYGGHKTARPCRACNVSFEDLDNPHHTCEWIHYSNLHEAVINVQNENNSRQQQKEAENKLHKLSTHRCINSFHNVCFGGDTLGILGATPTDLMHAFLEGVMTYAIRVFAAQLTPKQKASVDAVVDVIFIKENRTSERRNFPRVSYAKGITNLTLLTADEWGGVAFTLLILSMMERGRAALGITFEGATIMETMSQSSTGESVESSDGEEELSSDSSLGEGEQKESLKADRIITATDFIQLIEMLLSFHAWYERGAPYKWEQDSCEKVQDSIQTMMTVVKKILPRTDGHGWKVQKFHEMLHVPHNVQRFGSPQNYDASGGERSLKYWAKQPSNTAQKRGADIFTQQVADRIQERACVEKAKRAIKFDSAVHNIPNSNYEDKNTNGTNELDEKNSFVIGKSKFKLTMTGAKQAKCECLPTKKKQKGHFHVHPSIIKWFGDNHQLHGMGVANGYTEYMRNGLLFRAHPNYHSNGPWFDWGIVGFETDKDQNGSTNSDSNSTISNTKGFWNTQQVPCKFLCFLTDGDLEGDGGNLGAEQSTEIFILCHSCDYSDHHHDSSLCEVWELEYNQIQTRDIQTNGRKQVLIPTYRLVPVDSIVDRIHVVEEYPGIQETIPLEKKIKNEWTPTVIVPTPRAFWATAFTEIETNFMEDDK